MSEPMFKLIYARDLKPEDWDAEACLLFPETYLHPKDVIKLPDYWVERHDGVPLVIVTHSEHLLLRFQQMIRTGALTSEDVALEWDGKDIPLDEDGNLTEPLEGGCFEERSGLI